MFKKNPLAYTISCALAAGSLGLGNLALAQDPDAQDAANETEIEEVIVTGSRIKRSAFDAATPIDVIEVEGASVQGLADVGKLLQSTTVAAGSSQVTSATSTAFVQNGGTGVQTLSLRGLGANRTLTLLNGRRAGPAGVRGGVSAFDLNVLPLAAIERVEILKDGASSIYGSDAVAGVVNIITRKDDGGTVEGYIGLPQEDGGEETRFSASWGTSGERGRLRITADYHKNYELEYGDRDYLACPEQYIFDPASGDRADVIDPRTGSPSCRDLIWGHVWIYDYQDEGGNVQPGAKAQFDYDGNLGLFVPPFADPDPDNTSLMRTPPGWYPVNYDLASDGVTNFDHPFHDETSFVPETERTTFFADGGYNLTDDIELYGEVLLNRRKTTVNGYRQFWGYIYNYDFFSGNPLSAGWTGDQWLSPTPITDHSDSKVEIDYTRFVAGITGTLTQSWFWDLSFQHSESDGDYTEDHIYDDSISDQNFLAGSCVGMTTSVRGVPCVDIPWLDPYFLAGVVSPEVRDFLFGRDTGNTNYKQWSVEGFVSGDLFDWYAGTAGGAFGFHYREDEINDTPGETTLAGNAWGSSSAGITKGDDTTMAVFGEIDLPLLTDKPLVESLVLNASARWTDVDSYGDDTTYKVGLNWHITESWRVRASQGTSFRAPALYELYLADQTSFLNQRFIDPCIRWGAALDAGTISQEVADRCAATVDTPLVGEPVYPGGLPPDFTGGTITATIISGGGYGVLEAETSDSNTIGVVWQPQFANLSVSLDYFDIEVNDQVDQIGANGIVGGCYNSEFWPTDPLCELYDRSGLNGGIDNVRDSFINVATQTNKGWDFAVKWVTDVWGGSFEADAQTTHQTEAITALFEDTVRDENGQFGEPEWVGRLWLTYERNDWSYFWGMDYIGDVSNHEHYGNGEYADTSTYRGDEVRVVLSADSVTYHTFSVTKWFTDTNLKAVLGMRNAFDKEPPRVTTLSLGELSTAGWSAFYSQYDYYGRTFYGNVSWTF
ncbi:MAG: TonB-dependent receptor plug domain-containing protein [Lysobacterales bacterium]